MCIDGLLLYTPISREVYGYDMENKPNNHCYWDDDFIQWVEDDSHFRLRLKEELTCL